MAKLLSIDDLFKGRHFDRDVIILCVRWYLRYKLSFRDLVEMMAERGIVFSHTTVMRWVQCYTPEFEKRWNHFASPAGRSWRVDETYVKIRGEWVYLYRAVDNQGKTIDFRSVPGAMSPQPRRSFRKALKTQGRTPESITLEGYAASHRAIHEMAREDPAWQGTKVRSSKYLNNMIEQDHRGVKLRLGPMLGFKDFDHAATTIAGVELGIVFARASSPWGVCAFRGKLRLRSGTRCSPLDLLATSRNRHARSFQFAPEPSRLAGLG